MKKIGLFLLLIWAIQSDSNAQRTDGDMPYNVNIFPPSPNAASIAKFGDIPVSKYTGTPNIEVPLYTITTGDLAVPVSLSYHAGGMKVADIASNVGLGWALNCGGSITRTVRGLPDESVNGYLNNAVDVSTVSGTSATQKLAYFRDVNNNLIDLQSDVYYYNFFGKSGKFFVDKATRRGVLLNANENLQIEFVSNGSWLITDANGFKYYFGIYNGTTANERMTITQADRANLPSFTSNSTWQLLHAEDTRSNYIDFAYVDYTTSYCNFNNAVKYTFLSGPTSGGNCTVSDHGNFDQNEVFGKKVSQITWKHGAITFTYKTTTRTDVNTTDNALEFVEIKNVAIAPRVIMKWQLFYSYYNLIAGTTSICAEGTTGPLRLDKVQQIGNDGTTLPPYEFTYNSFVPKRNSNAQDHWGFYNGANTNNTLVPTMFLSIGGNETRVDGGNRSPDASFAMAGILTKIKYPTNGFTDFYFEGHDAYRTDFGFETSNSLPQMRYAKVAKSDMVSAPYTKQQFVVNSPFFYAGKQGAFFNLRVIFNNACDPSVRSGGCGGEIYIEPIPGTVGSGYIFGNLGTLSGTQNRDVFLENGTYQLVMEGYNSIAGVVYYSADLLGPDFSSVGSDGKYNKPIGGVRIAKIVNNDGNGTVKTMNYVYRQKNDPTKSSGVLVDTPVYASVFSKVVDPPIIDQPGTCDWIARSCNSKVALGTTQGSHIGYSYVEEIEGDLVSNNVNGKSGSSFITAQDVPDAGTTLFPFPPRTSFDMMRGLPTENLVYALTSPGTYTKIKSQVSTYKLDEVRNIKMQYSVFFGCKTMGSDGKCAEVAFSEYKDQSRWVWKLDDTQTEFSYSPSSSSASITSYEYGNQTHLLPTKITTRTGSGDILTKLMKYPHDFTDVQLDAVTLQMKNQLHILNQPIQIVELNGSSGAEKVTNTIIYKYSLSPNNKPIFSSKYSLDIRKPLDFYSTTEFPLYTPLSGTSGLPYTLMNNLSFNSSSNLVKLQNRDMTSGYLWSYDQLYPIASLTNGTEADFAYSSFEDPGKGGWLYNGTPTLVAAAPYPPTGQYYLLLNGSTSTLSRTVVSGNKYILSYWRNSSTAYSITGGTTTSVIKGETINGWTYFEHRITATSTTINISQSGGIDEVRFYPENSLMKTYVYLPLVGITASVDESGVISYYEYDSFNRLLQIKDMWGNILKRFEYKYKGQ